MTTSRIYAYRWPARLVSHKPFAAERYSITSSCIWQVFFRKNADFIFLFPLFSLPADFLCRMHNAMAVFLWKTPLTLRMPAHRPSYTIVLPFFIHCLLQKGRRADAQRPESQIGSIFSRWPSAHPAAFHAGGRTRWCRPRRAPCRALRRWLSRCSSLRWCPRPPWRRHRP